MALELLLKLNNQVINDHESSIKILNGYPTLNWEFDSVNKVVIDPETGVSESVEAFIQTDYDIEISTSIFGIGTGDFIGNVSRTGLISSQDLFWEYQGIPLERGNIYYGQIFAVDEVSRISEYKTFSFSFNSLPYVDNAKILPLLPSVTDNIQLSYDYIDDDGDLESGTTIRWFKNGSYQRQFDNATLIASTFLQNNDIWNVDIYPSDGHEFGDRVTSPQVKITPEFVEVSDVHILPFNPNPNDILKADYEISNELEQDNVFIRWYINNQIQQSLNDKQSVRPILKEGDGVRFEIKHQEASSYVSSPVVTIVSSDFVVTNIVVDGKTNPLDISTVTPHVKWQRFVPTGKSVNYISIKIGSFFGSSNIYSTVINEDRDTFTIPANTLEKGRDYYLGISLSDTQVFDKYNFSHFRVKGSRWEEEVSNSTGWTFEILFIVKTETGSDYQVISINDGTRFAEIRLYNDKIKFISGSQIEYNVSTVTNNFLTIAGKNDDIKIYLNRELIIDGEGIFTQSSNIKRLEIGDHSNTNFIVGYKYFFYTVSGYFLPGIDSEYSNLQFHTYMDFEDNEVVSLQSYIDGKYVFGLNPDNTSENSTIYAIKAGEVKTVGTIPRTFSPINKISKSPNGKITVGAHAKGVTVIRGYFIETYNNDLIFVDENNNLNEVFPTENGWELVKNINRDAAYFDENGFNIDTL